MGIFLLNGNKKIIMAKKYYRMRKYRKADPSMRGQISAIIRKHYIKANYDSEIIADEIVDLIKIKYQSK